MEVDKVADIVADMAVNKKTWPTWSGTLAPFPKLSISFISIKLASIMILNKLLNYLTIDLSLVTDGCEV